MARKCSIKVRRFIEFVGVPLMIAGIFLNSASAVAQDPIPFNAMMQSAGTQAVVPQRPDANGAQSPHLGTGHVTKAGKTEIGVGFLVFGAGILTFAATAVMDSSGFRPSGGKTPALYALGAGASAAGVTLVTFGFHRRSAR